MSSAGEMTRTRGSANVSGSIAYVSQQAWMRNMSLKDNIMAGKRYSRQLYEKVTSFNIMGIHGRSIAKQGGSWETKLNLLDLPRWGTY